MSDRFLFLFAFCALFSHVHTGDGFACMHACACAERIPTGGSQPCGGGAWCSFSGGPMPILLSILFRCPTWHSRLVAAHLDRQQKGDAIPDRHLPPPLLFFPSCEALSSLESSTGPAAGKENVDIHKRLMKKGLITHGERCKGEWTGAQYHLLVVHVQHDPNHPPVSSSTASMKSPFLFLPHHLYPQQLHKENVRRQKTQTASKQARQRLLHAPVMGGFPLLPPHCNTLQQPSVLSSPCW